MKKSVISLLFLLSIALGILFVLRRPTQKSQQITIICTTSMITDIVKTVVGNTAQVYGLMGPGVDPHLYRARESDVAKLSNADIIFYNGLHLEGKMADLFEKMKTYKKTVAVADAIPKEKLIASEFEGHYDPHIWFDVFIWSMVAKHIANVLCEYYPKHCPAYQQRAKDYAQKLDELDRYIQQQIATIPSKNRTLITAHDAFEYFGRRYGLNVRGLQGISTESEAGTKDVQELVNFIVQTRIPAIFVESSIPKRTVQAVREAVQAQGWNLTIGNELYSDALGTAGTPSGSYVGMVKHNIDSIVKGLRE